MTLAALQFLRSIVAPFRSAHLDGHSHRVGHRPSRVESRAVKRRPSPLALLTELCSAARARLLIGSQKM